MIQTKKNRTRIGVSGLPVGHPATAALAFVGLPLLFDVHVPRTGLHGNRLHRVLL